MARYSFVTVDVFTTELFGGNPLAVFPDARGISERRMQQVAREFNLSETTFVLPADAKHNDFRVRIFTPQSELPMAGHPTVGTAFALDRRGFEHGGRLGFEEGVGDVPVELDRVGDQLEITMQQPAAVFGEILQQREAVAGLLNLSTADLCEELPLQIISCGVPFFFVPLRSRSALRSIELQLSRWRAVLEPTGAAELFAFTLDREPGSDAEVHGRMFAPELGILEDPATGGACGPLGAYLQRYSALSGPAGLDVEVSQGVDMGRPSRIRVRISANAESGAIERVRVGGSCVAVSEGEMEIPD